MSFFNIEIKVRCDKPGTVRNILTGRNAIFKGLDYQIDTYFNCKYGRLKLREGNVENHLIHYKRDDKTGPKDSVVILYHPEPDSTLKEILANSLGIIVIVKKKREIYFVENVKFHIDTVEQLGSFIEIEAIDTTGNIGRERLLEQCEYFMQLFNIQKEDLVDCSYSDLLLQVEKGDSLCPQKGEIRQ